MPNNVKNCVTVLGMEDDVVEFVLAARGRRPPTGDERGSLIYQENAEVEDFSFHSLVPLPKEYSEVPYGDMSDNCGYNMERHTWGVKWGGYDHADPVIKKESATYRFTTAWSSPDEFMQKVSKRFPRLVICVSYGGEGPTRGRYAMHDGEFIVDQNEYYDADKYPKYDEYGDNREGDYYDAYYAVEQEFVNSHADWVANAADILEKA